MHSALFTGWVRHRRYRPHPHEFRYPQFMMYLDLDELPTLFNRSRLWSYNRRNLAWFKRSDYLGDPQQSLKEAVVERAAEVTGIRTDGPVRMLTHLRYFGYCFNPVTFYYLYHQQELHTIVAEITNTPWKQRHSYVLPLSEAHRHSGAVRFDFDKAFHVSPFMPMDMQYRWRFAEPRRKLLVHMDVMKRDSSAFDATLVMQRKSLSSSVLNRALFRFPFMCTSVLLRIHIQALKLWLKRNPVYDHPDKQTLKL